MELSESYVSDFLQGLEGENMTAGLAYGLFQSKHLSNDYSDLIAQSMKLFGNVSVVVDIATNPNATFSD
jgi:hypothetical protein